MPINSMAHDLSRSGVPDRPGRSAGPGLLARSGRSTMTQHDARQTHDIDLHSEYLRADLFLAMGQPIEAAKVLQGVLEAEPDNQAALELLARSYFGSAQLARAETTLDRLVQLAPANGWARRALARTLERQSRAADAAVHHRVADALGAA
jgi:predicted Zn-dependent protease